MGAEGVKPGVGATLLVRLAKKSDVNDMAGLLVRLKRLNAEFDPFLNVRDDAEEQAQNILTHDITDPNVVVLAVDGKGEDAGRVVGVARAQIRARPFYTPIKEGVILDIYLMPAYRRHGAGAYLLAETTKHLKSRGADLVTAEFPSQNEIAVKFYAKHGFRPVISLHTREVQ